MLRTPLWVMSHLYRTRGGTPVSAVSERMQILTYLLITLEQATSAAGRPEEVQHRGTTDGTTFGQPSSAAGPPWGHQAGMTLGGTTNDATFEEHSSAAGRPYARQAKGHSGGAGSWGGGAILGKPMPISTICAPSGEWRAPVLESETPRYLQ